MNKLKNKVFEYFYDSPINDQDNDKYKKVKQLFNIDLKTASRYWLEFKNSNETLQPSAAKVHSQNGDNLNITINTEYEIKTLDALLKACEVDTTKWKVLSWQSKKWDVGGKNKKQLFSVSAKFEAINLENSLELQKDLLLKELFNKAPKTQKTTYSVAKELIKDNLLELALFDVHFGKLAHFDEVGEDYDLKIACKRYKEAIKSLISRVNVDSVERILLPVGQDLINIDNLTGTTTGGTPQDTDSRFHKIVKVVKTVLIETIDELVTIAPVDVIITVGNHDEQTTFMIGEMLDAYYHNSADVNIFNCATLRKYYEYGVNSIMFTHGNREKFQELGMIFAAENPKLWAKTEQRFIQMGHFHHNKKVTTLHAQEFQGFQIQILPSLSGSDAWHKGKGYQSMKQAKAFLFNKKDGIIGEFTFTAK